jgi:hypothetical protein
MQHVVLEPSTNTHRVTAEQIAVTEVEPGTLQIETKGHGIVTHGEHGTLRTESPHIIKYVQQEYNPVTGAMQAAFD